VRIRPYGDEAVLVEPDDPGQVLAFTAAIRRQLPVREVVPAARTLLVRADPAALPAITRRLPDLATGEAVEESGNGADVVLDVRYDGIDLGSAAAELGLTPDELVRRHCAAQYVVAFCGFAPGFAYLRGLDPSLHLARLAEPRARVPAGSVGIAGEFTGVYPRESPGGWRLLGRTSAELWDLTRDPPALLTPGTRVRFRAA
jgi:KipI family sensor histidine kinase inhibitor